MTVLRCRRGGMTKSDGSVEDDERRFGPGGYPRDAMARGRWVNPLLGVLGALVLSGYLMTGHPFTPAATAPSLRSDEQLAPAQVPPQLAFSKETGSRPDSGVAQDEWTSASMTDLLKTALGAALALAWAVGAAWLGMRRARRSNARDEPADYTRTTAYPTHTALNSRRAPTCERMYDETRLVPQYLPRTQFPATKHDLVRLAREHTDEGQALRRLERIPDRRYSSLHDLISEIRVD